MLTNQCILGDSNDFLEMMLPFGPFIDCVVTDPPYLMGYATSHREEAGHEFETEIIGDRKNNKVDEDKIYKYFDLCYKSMWSNTAIYAFCNQVADDKFQDMMKVAGFDIRSKIVWVKDNWTAGDLECSFGRQYEFIIMGNKGRCPIRGKRLSDVWTVPRIAADKLVHQNEKPGAIMELCILKGSDEGHLIFDGYAGSGTTAAEAIKNNRKYIIVEKDPVHHPKCLRKIELAGKREGLFG